MRRDRRITAWLAAGLWLCAGLGAGGCATIVHGRYQTIPVTSEPPGADVRVVGVVQATTPGKIRLKRKVRSAVLRVEKAGYRPHEVRLSRHVDEALALNLLLGVSFSASEQNGTWISFSGVPLFGAGLDLLLGGAYAIDPASIHAPLERLAGSLRQSATPALLAEIESGLADARTMYQDARFAEAIVKLQEGIDRLKAVEGLGQRQLQLRDAYLHLALAHFALGHGDTTKQAFKAMLDVDPEARLDADVYAPRVLELLEEARNEWRAEGRAPQP